MQCEARVKSRLNYGEARNASWGQSQVQTGAFSASQAYAAPLTQSHQKYKALENVANRKKHPQMCKNVQFLTNLHRPITNITSISSKSIIHSKNIYKYTRSLVQSSLPCGLLTPLHQKYKDPISLFACRFSKYSLEFNLKIFA